MESAEVAKRHRKRQKPNFHHILKISLEGSHWSDLIPTSEKHFHELQRLAAELDNKLMACRYSFSTAVVTNYCQFSGLKQDKFIVSQFKESRILKSRCQPHHSSRGGGVGGWGGKGGGGVGGSSGGRLCVLAFCSFQRLFAFLDLGPFPDSLSYGSIPTVPRD